MAKAVEIRDWVYGRQVVTSSVVLDLLQEPVVQRLKRINQFGLPQQFNPRPSYSRFAHSLGVMMLIDRMGGGLAEQIAGLVHDVSHFAFSHTYDWVVQDATKNRVTEDEQDKVHTTFINQSGVGMLLRLYDFSPEHIANHHHFSLLEQPAPLLCADRVDYTLRELPGETARQLLSGLTVFNNQIVGRNLGSTAAFARQYLSLQVNHWGERDDLTRHYLFSELLKRGIHLGAIDLPDFKKDDSIFHQVAAVNDRTVKKNYCLPQTAQITQGNGWTTDIYQI